MSEHYHDAADLKLMKEMRKLAPADFDAWLGLDKIVGRDGAIPRKYRELMAIAVACTTQCPYCIDAYSKDSLEKGADLDQMTEAVHVAAAIRGGAPVRNDMQSAVANMRVIDRIYEKAGLPLRGLL